MAGLMRWWPDALIVVGIAVLAYALSGYVADSYFHDDARQQITIGAALAATGIVARTRQRA